MSKRKLPKFILSNNNREIDLDTLMEAFENSIYEVHWFFNSVSGEVENCSEDYPSFEKDMEEIDSNSNMHPVPELESWESYKFMENYNEEVVKGHDISMYEKLSVALRGKGAFRKFKDVLYDDEELLRKWHEYKDGKLTEEARSWLKSLGIKFRVL